MLSLPTPDSRVGPTDSGAGVPSARQSALRRKAGRSGVSEGPTPLCSTQLSLGSFTTQLCEIRGDKKDRRSRGFVFVRRAYPQTPRNVALGTRGGWLKIASKMSYQLPILWEQMAWCLDGVTPSSPAMHMTIPRRTLRFLIFFSPSQDVCVCPTHRPTVPLSQS